MDAKDLAYEFENNSPRHPLAALLLSFFFPGLGQLYNGQLKKAVALYLLLLVVPYLFGATKLVTSFSGYATMLLIMLAIWLYNIVDAFVQAKRKKQYALKKYNHWAVYLLTATFLTMAAWSFEKTPLSGTRNFNIVSPSQLPTMQPGDHVLADMNAYRRKKPDYGHIILFDGPDSGLWCFRVIGLPGDTIQMVDDTLIVNGSASKLSFIRSTIVDHIPVREYEEELINGHKHRIYSYQKAGGQNAILSEETIVPDNCYFLLGDNRGNAADSRYIGAVSLDDIRGQVLFSIWGKELFDRVNIDLRNR